MKTSKKMLNCIALVAVIGLIFTPGYFDLARGQTALFSQDLTLHETTKSSGAMGGDRSITSTNYFSRNAMKRTAPDGKDTIIRFDENRIITIDHKKKTYSSVSVQELNQMLEKTAAELGENKQQMEAMRKVMGRMMDSFTVKKIGPGEPVAGYKTEKYAVTGMMEMEIWAAPDLKMPGLYYDALKMSARPNPMFDQRKMYDEFKKINGMTLKSVTTMKMMNMEVKTETVVTSVDKSPIPAAIFEIPAGYKQVAPDMMK